MMDEILDVLTECAEFLDRYADYESDGYGGTPAADDRQD